MPVTYGSMACVWVRAKFAHSNNAPVHPFQAAATGYATACGATRGDPPRDASAMRVARADLLHLRRTNMELAIVFMIHRLAVVCVQVKASLARSMTTGMAGFGRCRSEGKPGYRRRIPVRPIRLSCSSILPQRRVEREEHSTATPPSGFPFPTHFYASYAIAIYDTNRNGFIDTAHRSPEWLFPVGFTGNAGPGSWIGSPYIVPE